jgi:hypothetical protein
VVKTPQITRCGAGWGSVAAPASTALANGGIWASPFGCKFAGLPLRLRAKTAADFFGWQASGRWKHDAKFVVHCQIPYLVVFRCDLQRCEDVIGTVPMSQLYIPKLIS